MGDSQRLFDAATNKWYEVKRGILGGLKLTKLNGKDHRLRKGDLMITPEGACRVVRAANRLDIA